MAQTSLLTTDQITDDVISHWRSEIKRLNPMAPDISIDNLLEQYRANPQQTEEVLEKAIETMETTLSPLDSVEESTAKIIKKGSPEYEEIMSLMNKQEQEQNDASNARSNDTALPAEQNDPAIVCSNWHDC
jgi:lipoate synthase